MSLLPQQIPPQTTIFGTVQIGQDGKPTGNVIIDQNWWLYFFNIGKQVLSGPTSPIPVPPAVNIALTDDFIGDTDAVQLPRKIANVQLLIPDQNVGPSLQDVTNAMQLASAALLQDPFQGPQGIPGPIGMPGLDGEQGEDGTIGPAGPAGAAGAAGVSGLPGIPIWGLDGEEAPEPMMIQGPQGAAGAAGATGATGPTGPTGPAGQPAIIILDGDQGEEGFVGAPGAPGPGFLSFDSHPDSPNAANDEFETKVLASKWTVQHNTAAVVNFSTYCPGSIWIKHTANTLYIISEAFVPGSADFSVTFKAYHTPLASFDYVGVQVSDSADSLVQTPGSGNGYALGYVFNGSSGTPAQIEADKWSAGSRTQGTYTNILGLTTNVTIFNQIYLHLQRVGGTWTAWWSLNGVVFNQYTGITFTVTPTVGFITLISAPQNSNTMYSAFDFVRVNQLFL